MPRIFLQDLLSWSAHKYCGHPTGFLHFGISLIETSRWAGLAFERHLTCTYSRSGRRRTMKAIYLESSSRSSLWHKVILAISNDSAKLHSAKGTGLPVHVIIQCPCLTAKQENSLTLLLTKMYFFQNHSLAALAFEAQHKETLVYELKAFWKKAKI